MLAGVGGSQIPQNILDIMVPIYSALPQKNISFIENTTIRHNWYPEVSPRNLLAISPEQLKTKYKFVPKHNKKTQLW